MPFAYLEMTRRQLAAKSTADKMAIPVGTDKKQRMELRSHDLNAMGNITDILNTLGADGWELVSVLESRSYGSEILYTFIKAI